MSDELILISKSFTRDEYGIEAGCTSLRPVLCEVNSISQSEWFEGGRNNLNPAYRFDVFFGDYEGEMTCIYKGVKYGIYRTFRNGDTMELYAEYKQGA